MDQSKMDRENMELVGVTHVVDAITFWAQNVIEDQAIEKMSKALADKCPKSSKLFGIPSPQQMYGVVFSEDRCWYRCKVQHQTDDKFHVSYVDYGNTEVVSRSALVELPEDLQSPCLAKKFKFWGFHVSSDKDSAHFQQGKAFLQNLIFGKKVRIQKRSVCFDGTILVQAFQGNLDIGEEVIKMKFATLNLPGGNRESPMSMRTFQDPPSLWAQWILERGPQGDLVEKLGMPKLRPALTDQMPQSVKEKSATTPMPANLLKKKMDQDLVEENERLKAELDTQQQSTQSKEKELRDTFSKLQELKEEMVVVTEEAETCKVERNTLQSQSEQLEKHLQDAKLELQAMRGESQQKEKEVAKLVDAAVAEQFSRLAEKVDSLRGLREGNPCNSGSDNLMQSISIVMSNSISVPVAMEKVDVAWENYSLAQEKLKACQTKEQLVDLINNRNMLRNALIATVDTFLQEAKCLPVRQRMDKLEEVSTSLTAVFGPSSMEGVVEHAFEQFYQWKTQRHQHTSSIRDRTDKALNALCTWSENVGKFFCLSSKTTVTLKDIAVGVTDLMKQADMNVCKELDISHLEPNNQDSKIMTDAFHQVMQLINEEKGLLADIMDKYLLNTKFKGEMLEWQNATPTPETLFSIKKRVRSLRFQMRWRQMEECSLEEAEELDLTEILKKKEEIAETRKALFQELGKEKEEYRRLGALTDVSFPELPLLYPEADIHCYMSSGGLLVKSLDRDIFDAEPMRELSGRRPLVCTEFQGQRVILKGYTVNEEAEARVLERTRLFHQARTENGADTGVLPLLALFFGKSDPLAYVMVPYFPNGSLKAVQAIQPLTATEVTKVMRGVAQGLQALHAVGVTHASLNPNNVFILNREHGMVGDFDFTKATVQRAMGSGMVAGSISLVAPELRQGTTPPSSACDLYSFGCLLLWLHVPKFSGALDDPAKLTLDVEPKLQTLLPKLLACEGRLTAAQVLADDYFLSGQA